MGLGFGCGAIRVLFSSTSGEPAGVRPAGNSLSLLVQRK
jgi:hypothetical protein